MELPQILKWTHKLGKSKRELKLQTPKRPKTKYKPCGCYCNFDFEKHIWMVTAPCGLHSTEETKNGGK